MNFKKILKEQKGIYQSYHNFEVIFGRYAQRSSWILADMYPNLKDKFKIDSNQDYIVY